MDAEEIIEAAARRMAELLAAHPTTAQVDERISAQTEPQIRDALTEQLRPLQDDRDALLDRVHALESELATRAEATMTVSARMSAAHNPAAVGAGLDGVFADAADFWRAAIRAGRPDLNYGRDGRLVDIGAALDGQQIAEGGALVPEEFRADMMEVMLQSAVIRPGAMVLPMSSETLRYPYVRDYDHSSGQVYGGWQVYRLERGDTVPRTSPTWGQQLLTATTQAARTVVSNLLLADAAGMSLAAFIEQGLPMAIGWAEDYDFLRGSGAGEPLGVLNSDALITTTDAGRRGSAATDYFVAQDAADMLARLLPACQRRAVFICHPGLYASIAAMTLSGAQFARREQSDDVPLFLNGRPVYFSEHCSAPGTSGDVILLDRSKYVIGDRQGVSVVSSPHVHIEELETAIIAYSRNDGQLLLERPVTLRHGGASWTVGCAVVLPDAAAGLRGTDTMLSGDPRLMSRAAAKKMTKDELVALVSGGADTGGADTGGADTGGADTGGADTGPAAGEEEIPNEKA